MFGWMCLPKLSNISQKIYLLISIQGLEVRLRISLLYQFAKTDDFKISFYNRTYITICQQVTFAIAHSMLFLTSLTAFEFFVLI